MGAAKASLGSAQPPPRGNRCGKMSSEARQAGTYVYLACKNRLRG
jgi:hypothetical protein